MSQLQGHQIGSHTWNHLDLTGLSAEEIRRELKQVADLIYDILQVNMTVFRPPYGSYNDLVLQIAQEFNYDVIIWNVDTEDWLHRENTTISIQAWINAVNANGAEGTYIGLHHDPYSGNTNLTQMTIDVLKSQLLKITTVADCIGKPMFYE
jgi:peptidoglycan/xylan/chitin deacetylase (PgdA/CDA1 family)